MVVLRHSQIFFFTIQLRVRISVGKLLGIVFALHGSVLGGDLPFEHWTVEAGVFEARLDYTGPVRELCRRLVQQLKSAAMANILDLHKCSAGGYHYYKSAVMPHIWDKFDELYYKASVTMSVMVLILFFVLLRRVPFL